MTTKAVKYNAVRAVLDDLGVQPAGEGEVRNLRRLHLTLSIVYMVFMLGAIVLLIMGRGTQIDAGYVFVNGHGEVVMEAKSTSVAEAFVPITSAVLAVAHMTMAASREDDIGSVARAGWSPLMSMATVLATMFAVAQLALVARIADPSVIYLLMMVLCRCERREHGGGGVREASRECVSECVLSCMSEVQAIVEVVWKSDKRAGALRLVVLQHSHQGRLVEATRHREASAQAKRSAEGK
jgi:preprotein translocase subunit SecG